MKCMLCSAVKRFVLEVVKVKKILVEEFIKMNTVKISTKNIHSLLKHFSFLSTVFTDICCKHTGLKKAYASVTSSTQRSVKKKGLFTNNENHSQKRKCDFRVINIW